MTADRYHRQQLMPGWNQFRLTGARVLVAGAGALGNEVLKNLALAGLGNVDVLDFDAVEGSNLSRCVLFREGDLGRNKAEAASARLRELQPGIRARALPLNVECQLGAGALRGYDLVLGCVDTIAARLALNRLCRSAGVVFLDGGLDASAGQVVRFDPLTGPCYQCSMTASMWQRVAERHGCLRQGSGEQPAEAHMPAIVTMAATVGAMQAQEALRWLLRDQPGSPPPLRPGERACFGSDPFQAAVLTNAVRPDCEVHARAASATVPAPAAARCGTIRDLLTVFDADSLSLEWDVVTALDCFDCSRQTVAMPLFALDRARVMCPGCGRVRVPETHTAVSRHDPLAASSPADLGVPPQAVLELGRAGHSIFVEFLAEQGSTPCLTQGEELHA